MLVVGFGLKVKGWRGGWLGFKIGWGLGGFSKNGSTEN